MVVAPQKTEPYHICKLLDEHKFVVFAWLALENKEDAEKCKDEPHSFQEKVKSSFKKKWVPSSPQMVKGTKG